LLVGNDHRAHGRLLEGRYQVSGRGTGERYGARALDELARELGVARGSEHEHFERIAAESDWSPYVIDFIDGRRMKVQGLSLAPAAPLTSRAYP
jgi:hypothetical protein